VEGRYIHETGVSIDCPTGRHSKSRWKERRVLEAVPDTRSEGRRVMSTVIYEGGYYYYFAISGTHVAKISSDEVRPASSMHS